MMGRRGSRDENGLKKGPWSPEEDRVLVDYIKRHGGHGSWRAVPKLAGLNRCGKSCRLRWTNYLRPDIKRGKFSEDEEQVIFNMHALLGNKWAAIASHLAGRTDNDIKNFWNTHMRRKLLQKGLDPVTHRPRSSSDHGHGAHLVSLLQRLLGAANIVSALITNTNANATDDATRLHNMLHHLLLFASNNNNNNNAPGPILSPSSIPNAAAAALYEALGLINNNNNKLDHNLYNTLFPSPHHLQNETHFQSFDVPPPDHQKVGDDEQVQVIVDDAITPPFNNNNNNSLLLIPNLVSSAQECSTNKQMGINNNNNNNPNDEGFNNTTACSSSSTTSTTFQMLADFINEEAPITNAYYWKDIIPQDSYLQP